ncbi:hypothetical protein [Vibrio vulnificus]|uniref:hypothetical protein n=1 Tax=Vibrio vulnificus TaxID=672 RepID=UPI000CA18E3D|nr:hypothetical protein [Vibrio vulnificus]AUL98725.1 hypothetical protein FORC54_p036 [Vibrio vulnificus]
MRWFLGIILYIFSSVSSLSYAFGDYPRLSLLLMNDNSHYGVLLKDAIESSRFISVQCNKAFKSAIVGLLLPSNKHSKYEQSKLDCRTLLKAINSVSSTFTCSLYRYRNKKIESSGCNGYSSDREILERMPFVDGQYVDNNIEANIDDKINNYSYQVYLENSNSTPLTDILGSVHELGTFFGRPPERRSLILTIKLNIYLISNNDWRVSPPINPEPIPLKLLIPSPLNISKMKDELDASRYVRESSLLISIKDEDLINTEW